MKEMEEILTLFHIPAMHHPAWSRYTAEFDLWQSSQLNCGR